MDEDTKETARLMIGEGYSSFSSDLIKLYDIKEDMEMRSYISKLYLSDARRKLANNGTNRKEIMDALGYLDMPFHIEYTMPFLGTRKKQEDESDVI